MSASPAELDVSIVLPVHNEAGHLQAEIDRIAEAMDASAHSWELIIVDDGSSDSSTEIAIADPRTRVIRAERNRGAGTARRIGNIGNKRFVLEDILNVAYHAPIKTAGRTNNMRMRKKGYCISSPGNRRKTCTTSSQRIHRNIAAT